MIKNMKRLSIGFSFLLALSAQAETEFRSADGITIQVDSASASVHVSGEAILPGDQVHALVSPQGTELSVLVNDGWLVNPLNGTPRFPLIAPIVAPLVARETD
jgi:hypothetical protein